MGDRNPWLDVPADDYEGHMGHPEVAQLAFLSRAMGNLLRELHPAALAVPGSAMGTGFEHIDPKITRRVLAVDIQPDYLEILRRRHSERLSGLETVCADLADFEADPAGFDLVFAALIFEYLTPGPLLKKFARWLRPGGTLCSLLQLPGKGPTQVSRTPFEGVRILEPLLNLVDPQDQRSWAQEAGLRLADETVETLSTGKTFHIARFVRETATIRRN